MSSHCAPLGRTDRFAEIAHDGRSFSPEQCSAGTRRRIARSCAGPPCRSCCGVGREPLPSVRPRKPASEQVILGGLITSTFLNLIVVPALYVRAFKRAEAAEVTSEP